jgi:nitrite reductase/ring-hydroxylating ferredoxin subunit
MTDPRPTFDRRRALTGAATVGLALPVLAACAGADGNKAVDAGTDPGSGATTGQESPGAGSGGNGAPLTTKGDVPVGSGVIFNDQQVVVTQPTEGEFRCFSAVCTHQGCIVSSVQLGGIRCECHGSAFSIVDGSVVNPPATRPLPAVPITVKGNDIRLS